MVKANPIKYRTFTALSLAIFLQTFIAGATRADEPAPFEGYENLCGYQIIYWPTRHLALSHITPDGREVIILDPILQRSSETPRRLFLTAHECAHHRMGHSSETSVEKRVSTHGEVRGQELSADCWAAETLTRAGYFEEIESIAIGFYKDGANSPGHGYPSGIQRALMIKRCSDEIPVEKTHVRQIARNGAILSIFD